jgi:hypothetical protein
MEASCTGDTGELENATSLVLRRPKSSVTIQFADFCGSLHGDDAEARDDDATTQGDADKTSGVKIMSSKNFTVSGSETMVPGEYGSNRKICVLEQKSLKGKKPYW